jgi:hypothetical protein
MSVVGVVWLVLIAAVIVILYADTPTPSKETGDDVD